MQIRADEGSFKDPSGRVYRVAGEHGEKIVRALDRDAVATLTRLLAESFFQDMMRRGDVIGTDVLSAAHPHARAIVEAGWHGAIAHQTVDFLTWPYEWPFSMLKDAALLQLRLLEASVPNGWILKDATPFNVQWRGAQPTLIDVPSFVPWDGQYWRAYRQFCATHLTPLLLMAHLGLPFQPLLRSRFDGISPEEATRYFRGMQRLRRGVPSHIWFPAKAERASARRSDVRPRSRQRQSQTMLRALIDSLRRLITGLSYRPASSQWTRYADAHSYGADYGEKERFVAKHTAAERPALVWDVGANTGAMAQIAAQSAGLVIAVDSDHDAIELLYRKLRAADEPQNIVPLVMDLANPSPDQGWAGRERSAFDARRRPDMVLCLALIHHLRVSANIPLALLLEWLHGLRATVIIEFVEREDEMFRRLLANKDEQYSDYTAQNFHCEVARRFTICERLRLKHGLRELLLLKPR